MVEGDGTIHVDAVIEAMKILDIDELGLDTTDRKLLAAIIQKFQSGPVGVQALAAVLAEEPETIEDVLRATCCLRPRLPRPDAAGPHRDRVRARAPGVARLGESRRPAARSRTCPRSGTMS